MHLTKAQKDIGNIFWSLGIVADLQRAVLSHPQAGTDGRSDECPGFSTLPVQWDQSGWLVSKVDCAESQHRFLFYYWSLKQTPLFAFLPNFHMYICHQRAKTEYVSLFSWEHWSLSVLCLYRNTRGKFTYNEGREQKWYRVSFASLSWIEIQQ